MFVDRVKIEAIAGRGGNGCMSFRREKYVPRGGPNGGDGGNGGSIIIVAEKGVNSLVDFAHRKHIRGENGKNGQGYGCHGAAADDTIIKVPAGTIVIDAANDFVLKDLAEAGDSVIAAQGGKGGKGNTRFKSSTNQAPRQAQPGGEGEKRMLIFELKVIADVGLIGMPNAGKSTLLSRLSAARPEIANYPFTTKFPNLGQVRLDLDRSFIMADIPGLIEGAADGVGLGHDFLKHIERAGVLVHLVEPMPMDQSDPVANYHAIRKELIQFNPALGQRPEMIVVSKSELPGADDVAAQLRADTNQEVHLMSAATGNGLPPLINAIDKMLTQHRAEIERAKAAEAEADAPVEETAPSNTAGVDADSDAPLGTMNIITVDIGNSATKIVLDAQSTPVRVDLGDLNSLAVAAGSHHWVIVSVAPQSTKTLTVWLETNRPDDKVTVISNDDIPIKSSVKNRAGVGTDRLLVAYAGTQRNQDSASVVVDAGTAVTIDYVNSQGTFCGGMIFPGVSTNLKALATNTAVLPDLANKRIEPVTHDIRVGDDTKSAILNGVAQSQAWAIVEIAEKLARQHQAQVFITGGDAALVKNIMPVSWQHVPNLIHDGCRQLFQS